MRLLVISGFLLTIGFTNPGDLPAQSAVNFASSETEVVCRLSDQPIFHYIFKDSQIPRPYFAHIKTPSGKQVSRNHPPKKGVDKEDHATMHPGIWLSFGDINGNDYWRLKSQTRHKQFTQSPKVTGKSGSLEVLNEYLSSDGDKVICTEQCRIEIEPFEQGYVLKIASDFSSADADLTFGDQEEMGLGIRLTSPLAVDAKRGGRILDSEGRKNGDLIWGKTAAWCDYAGPLDGKWAGMTILTSPKNFRPSWAHARDYGFVAMNPFGLNAFTKAKRNDIIVKRGERLRLSYAVVVHESEKESDYNAKPIYERYSKDQHK
jgi:hypothetical protein